MNYILSRLCLKDEGKDYISISIGTVCQSSTSGWKPPPLTIGLGRGSPSRTICTLRGSGAEWI